MLPALVKKFVVFYFLAFLLVSSLALFHCQLNSSKDVRCPAISQYSFLPSSFSSRYTGISSEILKQFSVYFFRDFVELLSAEAVHFLVYSGVFANLGYLLMTAWIVLYAPYALMRALIRIGLVVLLVVAVISLFSFLAGAFDGGSGGSLKELYETVTGPAIGKGNWVFGYLKDLGFDALKRMFGVESEGNQEYNYSDVGQRRYPHAPRN